MFPKRLKLNLGIQADVVTQYIRPALVTLGISLSPSCSTLDPAPRSRALEGKEG